MLGGRFVVDTV